MSTQAIRNYGDVGALPPARRTASGYRDYTPQHAAALRAYLALIKGHGHAAAGRVMIAANAGDLATALAVIDAGHAQLTRDRETLAVVRTAIDRLVAAGPEPDGAPGTSPASAPPMLLIGALAGRLRISPATLRAWERVGILRPDHDPITARRLYSPIDVRDADLAELLRRGRQPLAGIAVVIDRIRSAGGIHELAMTLDGWGQRLTDRGSAMLTAAAQLSRYLDGDWIPDRAAPDRSTLRSEHRLELPS